MPSSVASFSSTPPTSCSELHRSPNGFYAFSPLWAFTAILCSEPSVVLVLYPKPLLARQPVPEQTPSAAVAATAPLWPSSCSRFSPAGPASCLDSPRRGGGWCGWDVAFLPHHLQVQAWDAAGGPQMAVKSLDEYRKPHGVPQSQLSRVVHTQLE